MNKSFSIKISLYKLKRFFFRRFDTVVFKGLKKYDLIIFDDIYPHPISGFRLEEFTFLLNNVERSKIIVDPKSYKFLNTPLSEHQKNINDIIKNNSNLEGKIFVKKNILNLNTKLFYCVFLNNIYGFLPYLEKYKIPFMFTLYPGGGLRINDEKVDEKLKKIFSSKMFRGVFTTQKYTTDYLLNNNLCSKEKIHFIFGCVVPQISLKKEIKSKKYFSYDKKEFNICFCAVKYTKYGQDKGYDTFINVIEEITKKYNFVTAHVIGGFDESTIDVSSLGDKIKFYGYKKFDELSNVFKYMDIIISPNKPFYLNKGEFDGFPLGTVVEAVFNGVVALLSDELNQNYNFTDLKDLIIIKNNKEDIFNKIEFLINNPEELKKISNSGIKKFKSVYSNSTQMKPRLEVMNEIIFDEKN